MNNMNTVHPNPQMYTPNAPGPINNPQPGQRMSNKNLKKPKIFSVIYNKDIIIYVFKRQFLWSKLVAYQVALLGLNIWLK